MVDSVFNPGRQIVPDVAISVTVTGFIDEWFDDLAVSFERELVKRISTLCPVAISRAIQPVNVNSHHSFA